MDMGRKPFIERYIFIIIRDTNVKGILANADESTFGCNPITLSYFIIKDNFKCKKIEMLETALYDRIDQEKEKIKAQTLKDF